MKYIINVGVPIESEIEQNYLKGARCLEINRDGAMTTLIHFLCGDNPWGYHQDLRFTGRPSDIRCGQRIMQAAEKARDEAIPFIALLEDDYALLVKAISQPQRMRGEAPLPPAVARTLMPFLEAIENATDEVPIIEKPETPEA